MKYAAATKRTEMPLRIGKTISFLSLRMTSKLSQIRSQEREKVPIGTPLSKRLLRVFRFIGGTGDKLETDFGAGTNHDRAQAKRHFRPQNIAGLSEESRYRSEEHTSEL